MHPDLPMNPFDCQAQTIQHHSRREQMLGSLQEMASLLSGCWSIGGRPREDTLSTPWSQYARAPGTSYKYSSQVLRLVLHSSVLADMSSLGVNSEVIRIGVCSTLAKVSDGPQCLSPNGGFLGDNYDS